MQHLVILKLHTFQKMMYECLCFLTLSRTVKLFIYGNFYLIYFLLSHSYLEESQKYPKESLTQMSP